MKKYTIREIAQLNADAGGLFFSVDNMAGETLDAFTVIHRYGRVFVRNGSKRGTPDSLWEFRLGEPRRHRMNPIAELPRGREATREDVAILRKALQGLGRGDCFCAMAIRWSHGSLRRRARSA